MLFEEKAGHALLELIQGEEAELCGPLGPRPLTHALVLARHAGKTLLVFNRYRQEWELPGGIIDPGENAGEAALRELMEESNQTLPTLRFVGLMRLRLKPDDRLEFGALYQGEVSEPRPFQANQEIEGVCWWDGGELAQPIAGIDRWLAQYLV